MNTKNIDEISEFICPKCGGTGEEGQILFSENKIISTCQRCGGYGKLDWIERIVGKKPNKNIEYCKWKKT